jgi:hypothetical protein
MFLTLSDGVSRLERTGSPPFLGTAKHPVHSSLGKAEIHLALSLHEWQALGVVDARHTGVKQAAPGTERGRYAGTP